MEACFRQKMPMFWRARVLYQMARSILEIAGASSESVGSNGRILACITASIMWTILLRSTLADCEGRSTIERMRTTHGMRRE